MKERISTYLRQLWLASLRRLVLLCCVFVALGCLASRVRAWSGDFYGSAPVHVWLTVVARPPPPPPLPLVHILSPGAHHMNVRSVLEYVPFFRGRFCPLPDWRSWKPVAVLLPCSATTCSDVPLGRGLSLALSLCPCGAQHRLDIFVFGGGSQRRDSGIVRAVHICSGADE